MRNFSRVQKLSGVRYAVFMAALLLPVVVGAQITNYAVIHSFDAAASSGAYPRAGVIEGTDGSLYGTTADIAANDVIFRLSKGGSGYEVVSRGNSGFGAYGFNDVIEVEDRLYMTTTGPGGLGRGTVFSVHTDGSGGTNLHVFDSTNDGVSPLAGLLRASDGRLYGTTSGGFFNAAIGGTVFGLNPDGSGYHVLHVFGSITDDGWRVEAPVIEGSDGYLYGTTVEGGGGANNWGTVFKLRKDGQDYEILHRFGEPGSLANHPKVGLLEGSDGLLYGMTWNWIFRLTKQGGNFQLLHQFQFGLNANGSEPEGPLVEGADGMLYGATSYGGFANAGAIFRINKDGSSFAVLHSFGLESEDGNQSFAGLFKANDGMFYGTTLRGGEFNAGTIFRFGIVNLPPAFKSQPASLTNFPGSNATFSVIVEGPAPFAYWWRKDGVLLNEGGSIAGTRTNTLELSNLTSGSAGGYSVVVSNNYGAVTSTVAQLTVILPPSWVSGPRIEGNTFLSRFLGTPGAAYSLQMATELPAANWQHVRNVVAPATDEGFGVGVLELVEPINLSVPQRFYRLQYPPQ